MSDIQQAVLLTFIGTLSVVAGFGFTNTVRLCYKPHQFITRTFMAMIWIGSGGIGVFLFTADADLSNLLTGCALIGFAVRTAMEMMLGYNSRPATVTHREVPGVDERLGVTPQQLLDARAW